MKHPVPIPNCIGTRIQNADPPTTTGSLVFLYLETTMFPGTKYPTQQVFREGRSSTDRPVDNITASPYISDFDKKLSVVIWSTGSRCARLDCNDRLGVENGKICPAHKLLRYGVLKQKRFWKYINYFWKFGKKNYLHK